MAFHNQQRRQPYRPCDSFFIDSDDDTWYEQKAQERERQRSHAKERQSHLASDLSRITGDEYSRDVVREMERLELLTIPDVNSIDIQTEIQWYMRPYLLDFLVEAHSAFALCPDTLYLAVNLLDRYCSKRVVYKRHYQLVGCAALLIAAKYGDRKDRVPQIKELKAMCCSLYEEEMFIQMEWHLLQTLDWTIGHPTVDAFLQVAMTDSQYDPEVEHMSCYITELALFHKEFISIPSSVMAKSALALSRCILSRPFFGQAYDPNLVARLYQQLQEPSSVVSKKYATFQFSSASIVARGFIDRERSKQLAPPTPPVDSGMFSHTAKPSLQAFTNPQTPQKIQYQSMMDHGLYTPPITPQNDNAGAIHYVKHQSNLSSNIPITPTSPCVVEQHCDQDFDMDYAAAPTRNFGYYPS